eukprot:scaffold34749_cov139-Skeletonema_marinoi.AAC.4
MFSTNTNQQQQPNEPITASKNVSAWESLILDLESHGEDDDGEEGGGFLNGGASSSLPLSTRSGNGGDEEKMEQESEERLPQLFTNIHQDSNAAAPNASNDRGEQQATTKLKSPSRLHDWMSYHPIKKASHANHMGRKVDAAYTLKAAQIALSLAKYLGRQFEQDNIDEESHREDLPSISFEDIIVDNVIVKNVESGEAVSAVLESTSSTSGGATNHRSGCNTERRQVLALGMILYELFTEGNPPPTWLQQSLKSSASALSFRFSKSLRISEQSEEDDDRGASGGDRRKNKDDDDDDMDESDQQEPFVRKQRLRRCDEKGKEESVPTLLKLAGVPRSICRLISDMLSNRGDNDVAGLFQCDKSVSCFAEVIMDLEQMVEQPKDFLYDTVRLNPKPIVRNKLYSRQKELEQGIELAGRCVMDASSSVKQEQEVLVISGLSGEQLDWFVLVLSYSLPSSNLTPAACYMNAGSGKSSLVNELIAQLKSNGWESLHCKFDQIGRRQPLSTIASAFDSLFFSLLSTSNLLESGGNDTLGGMRTNLLESFDEEGFPILFHLMPNLRRVVTNDDNSTDIQQTDYVFDESAMIPSKIRMHNLFYELLKAITSSRGTPMLLFLDDLHWADSASLDLISFLIDEMGASITEDTIRGTNLFIIGTVRTNEVDNSSDLTEFLQKIRSCHNVTITDMSLQDLSPDGVNVMTSEALCYSQRLTRSLAGIVHQKTEGNPFFVKEFLNDLTVENLLVCRFSERTWEWEWEWDEELIESRTISDGDCLKTSYRD